MTYPRGDLPPLITRRLLEAFLQVEPGSLPDDTAQAAIEGASGAVRDECGWRIDFEAVEAHRLTGDGSKLLFLPTARLLTVDFVSVFGEEWTPYTPGNGDQLWDYSTLFEAAALKARGFRRWPERGGAIEVDFTHGYPLIDVDPSPPAEQPLHLGLPQGLESIILAVAARSLSNPGAYTSLKVANVSETFTGIPTSFVLSQSEQDRLAPYRVTT